MSIFAFAFTIGGWLLALLSLALFTIFIIFFPGRRASHRPTLYYSRVAALQSGGSSWRTHLASLPHWLFFTALACFAIAWLDPRVPYPASRKSTPSTRVRPTPPRDGAALYLLLDQSGSMDRVSPADPLGPTKFEHLQKSVAAFIKERPNDLIGLIGFARAATILAPLTLDHDTLIQDLQRLHPLQGPAGEATGIGYAIFKTVNLITATKHFAQELAADGKPSYTLNDSAIVVITDGFQENSPLDKGKWMRTMGMEEAAEYAKANDIRLYIVNMEPALSQENYAPHRRLLERVTRLTGGQLFLASDPSTLASFYQQIDILKPSQIPGLAIPTAPPKPVPQRPLYAFFLGCGLCALAAAITLSSTLMRQLP